MTLLFFFGDTMSVKTAKLATGLVVTSADDQLAAVDVYSGTPTVPLNLITSNAQSLIDETIGPLTGFLNDKNLGNLRKLADVVNRVTSADAINNLKAFAKSSLRVENLFPNVKLELLKGAGLSELTDKEYLGQLGLPSALTNGLTDSLQLPGIKLVSEANDLYKTVEQMDNFKSFSDSFGALTGVKDFLTFTNLTEEFNILGSIVSLANRLGIKGAVEKITEKYADKDKTAFLLHGLVDAAGTGDIDYIIHCKENVSATAMLAVCPNLVPLILKSYMLNQIDKSNINKEASDHLLSILDSIDPKWWVSKRGTQEISNLSVYKEANPNILNLLMLNNKHRVAAMISRTYAVMDIVSLVKQSYPTAGMTT